MPTNARHTRICDQQISFGMQRYATGTKPEDLYLWKFIISRYCGNDVMFSSELDVQDLLKIKQVIEDCINILETDGERKEVK